MKLCYTTLALVLVSGLAAAQDTDSKSKMKVKVDDGKSVTVTGCVERSGRSIVASPMRPLVIRSTRVMLPSGLAPAALHLADERLERIARYDEPTRPEADLHDVGSFVVMPGLVDTHVHLNDPGRAD